MINIIHANFDAMHKKDFNVDLPEGYPFWLLLHVHTRVVIRSGDKEREYPPNTMILYKPHQQIHYRACGDSYSDDWIRFETNDISVMNAPIPFGTPFTIREYEFVHMIIRMIASESHDESNVREDTLEKLMLLLLNKIIDATNVDSPEVLCKDVHDLHRMIREYPHVDWSIPKMAKILNISKSYLSKKYKEAYKRSCMEEVIISRTNMAKNHFMTNRYLEKEINVNKIAMACGYKNINHFYRQFKQMTGMTPGEYMRMPDKRTNPE